MLEKTKWFVERYIRVITKIMIYWILIALILPLLFYLGKRIYRKYPNFHFTIHINRHGNRIKVFLLSIVNLIIVFFELITVFTIFIYIGFKYSENKNKNQYVSLFKEYIKTDNKPKRSKF